MEVKPGSHSRGQRAQEVRASWWVAGLPAEKSPEDTLVSGQEAGATGGAGACMSLSGAGRGDDRLFPGTPDPPQWASTLCLGDVGNSSEVDHLGLGLGDCQYERTPNSMNPGGLLLCLRIPVQLPDPGVLLVPFWQEKMDISPQILLFGG